MYGMYVCLRVCRPDLIYRRREIVLGCAHMVKRLVFRVLEKRYIHIQMPTYTYTCMYVCIVCICVYEFVDWIFCTVGGR
jgi:hypothetical protein